MASKEFDHGHFVYRGCEKSYMKNYAEDVSQGALCEQPEVALKKSTSKLHVYVHQRVRKAN